MTEPVARVTSVRRTVTVATALVASQALLCVVIGWVTFGNSDHSGSSSTAQGPVPDLGPAPVVPPASVRPVAPERLLPQSAKKTTIPRATAPRTALPTKTQETPKAPKKTHEAPPPKPPAKHPPGGRRARQPSSAPQQKQKHAELGEKCGPANADGITDTGRSVSCRTDRHGDLVWQIN